MKIVETINFVPFYDKVKTQSMSALAAYKFAKIYAKAKEDETFYQDKLREILFKYGELDEQGNLVPTEDGNGIKIKVDSQEECINAINELQDIESELQFEPISMNLLASLELTPSDIEGIMGFIAE